MMPCGIHFFLITICFLFRKSLTAVSSKDSAAKRSQQQEGAKRNTTLAEPKMDKAAKRKFTINVQSRPSRDEGERKVEQEEDENVEQLEDDEVSEEVECDDHEAKKKSEEVKKAISQKYNNIASGHMDTHFQGVRERREREREVRDREREVSEDKIEERRRRSMTSSTSKSLGRVQSLFFSGLKDKRGLTISLSPPDDGQGSRSVGDEYIGISLSMSYSWFLFMFSTLKYCIVLGVFSRSKEMEDLRLHMQSEEKQQRTKRLSMRVDEILSHRYR